MTGPSLRTLAAALVVAPFVVWLGVQAVDGGTRKLTERSHRSFAYPVDWRHRYLAEHRHVRRLLVVVRRLRSVRRVQAYETPEETIRRVFDPYGEGGNAVRVAWCEGRFNPAASNGQFLGTFQMGSVERATWGFGDTVEEQARAALRMFLATRYEAPGAAPWHRWECRP